MGPSFDPRSRFTAPGEYDRVRRLLQAAGIPTGDAVGPGSRALSAVRARVASMAPPLVRRLGRGPEPSPLEFCRAVEEITHEQMSCELSTDVVRWRHGGATWVYPASTEKLLFFGFLTAVGPAAWLRAKYTLPGFVDFEPDDVVVDCGAFVGGFSRAALDAGASVLAVEPSRSNRRALEANLAGQGVTVAPNGLGDTNRTAAFSESSTRVDSSFGPIDEGQVTNSYTVDIVTVDELCARFAVSPTFVKVEAEGMESRIIEGMRTLRPRKIAVDASPEGGRNDREAIATALRRRGYTVRTDVDMVYARL